MKKLTLFLSAVIIILATTSASLAISYDLAADWSDINNPNGVWSYNQGDDALPQALNWHGVSGMTAWAYGSNSAPGGGHIPVWLKLSADDPWGLDADIGDVLVHGMDDWANAGVGEANVTWTSGISGFATISGEVWMTRDIDRNMDWNLYLNDALITSGNVYSGDPYSRANPFGFENGSGGASALSFDVELGDVITFETYAGAGSSNGDSDFIGVNLTIDVPSPVPVPATMMLLSSGLLGLVGFRRKTKRS